MRKILVQTHIIRSVKVLTRNSIISTLQFQKHKLLQEKNNGSVQNTYNFDIFVIYRNKSKTDISVIIF